MPRPSKQATTRIPASPPGSLELVVREAEVEAAKASEVSRDTRLTYEDNAKLLAEGWDMASAAKGTRYAMRAAGLFTMRRQLRTKLREAKSLLAKGKTGDELFPVRQAQWRLKVGEVAELLQRIRDFDALPWATLEPGRRQVSHKQVAATDAQLTTFYEAAGASIYRAAFLVAEFSGARGKEFGNGIRVETCKKAGVATLSFFIESAKCDGRKKGLDLRQTDVAYPSKAAEPVRRRWLELANLAAKKGGHVVKIEPTDSSTAGLLFTAAVRDVAKKAGVKVAAYSLRHRFSSQAKQSGDAVSVALALGHQTTETQRHYGRSKRGGGAVSPVSIVGVNVSGATIRGAPTRSGPAQHVKQKIALAGAIAQAPPASQRPRL